ncbi:MAG: sigma-70 family RNA polymerase sigma factor [Myxococcales bacterium]|nr:sigma-70 family RNA polymerase sigma factor [Myxococcales bacterium]
MSERRGREASLLVEAAKRGEPGAFDGLVRKYRPRIYALALHLTGRPSDADDITQDAFLRAYSKIESFEGRSEFFTWLYRIALHRALNVKRDRGRRRTVGLEDARVDAAIAVDAVGDPRRALELRESYTHLLAAFDELSESLRTTVVLTTLQGLSYREAAVVLETNEGTIAWRVHEARRKIRGAMERLEHEPAPRRIQAKARRIRDCDVADRLEFALRQLLPV